MDNKIKMTINSAEFRKVNFHLFQWKFIEISRNLLKLIICSFWILIFTFLFVKPGFGDILRLREIPEGKDGNEVEILEEREDSFIIKVPKEEIESIQRKRPTEIKAWREKRILWEDTADYITIYLPKEKIVLPENYTGQEYDSAQALKKELGSTGAEGRPEIAAFWKGTGKVTGKAIKGGRPLAGVRLKLVNVSPADTLSRIFGPDEKRPQDFVLEAVTNEIGQYAFNSVPLGEYDIYWALSGTESWYRRLSEKPDITVRPAETVQYPDIEIK